MPKVGDLPTLDGVSFGVRLRVPKLTLSVSGEVFNGQFVGHTFVSNQLAVFSVMKNRCLVAYQLGADWKLRKFGVRNRTSN